MKRLVYTMLACMLLIPANSAMGQEADGKAVDLGLSVLWADRNVGAVSPYDYSILFDWNDFDKRFTPGWLLEIPAVGGYINFSGTINDFATRLWGDGWRLPTSAEIDELREKCSWTWETVNGVGGMKVTGLNGNSIFLPASGRKDHGDMYDIGEYGHYWSGSISSDYGHYMFELVFRDNGHYFALVHKNAEGRAVRPVQDK